MQTRDSSEAETPESRGLSLPWWRNWYIDRHGDRIYWVYTPASYKVGTAVPLIMVLHGCMQPFNTHPWAIARDTHMNQLAETHQFLVVYPHEFAPPDVNGMSCWNFFLPQNQRRGSGEPASLAGIVQDMLNNTSRWTIDQDRVYVAGISSGGGATANLGATYPDVFAAIAVHSGGEYGYPLPFIGKQARARDIAELVSEQEALSGEVNVFLSEQAQARDTAEPLSEQETLSGEVVEGGKEVEKLAVIPPGPDPTEQGKKAFQAMGSFNRVMPVIVFHGTADPVSDPINGDQVAQQWITTNHLASPSGFTATYEHPTDTVNHPAGPHKERPYTVYTWQDTQGLDVVTYYKVERMGHAWSGGTPPSIFTDQKGPDASKIMYEFFMAHPKERKKIKYPLPGRPISGQAGRRALCVGINQFKDLPRANWLNGCVNDAQDMASVLQDLFGFSENQIRVLTDAQATKAEIYSELQDMVQEATNGHLDYLVFSFSSHGTQVPDLTGEEPDWADEALCAHDIRAAGNHWDPSTVLVDDELHDLFTKLPRDVLLEVYFDTCHSGTGLRAADLLPGRRPKFLPPPTSGGLRDLEDRRVVSHRGLAVMEIAAREREREVMEREIAVKTAHPGQTLFAACLDSQTASDALFEGRPNGAFTYFLVKQIRATGNNVSRQELLARVSADLKNAGFTQTPQYEASASDRSVPTATTKTILDQRDALTQCH